MTMRANALITADASQAKAATKDLKGDIDQLTGSTRKVGSQTDKATQSGGRFGRVVDSLRGRLSNARTRLTSYIQGLRTVDETQKLAAGSVGNLTAQFNDIGVMLAAGQNPLQLALQQGTQITQVLGNQGAGKAVRSLGAALLSVVSPLNLITIGSIAAGATLFQWLSKSEDEAKSLEETLEDLKDAAETLTQSEALAAAPREAMQEYQNLIRVINEVSRLERARAAEAALRATGLVDAIASNNAANSVAAQIGSSPVGFDFMGLDHISEANFLLERSKELMAASKDEQAATLDDMVEALQLRGIMTDEVRAYVTQLASQLGITNQLVEREKDRAQQSEKTTNEAAKHLNWAQTRLAELQEQAAIEEAIQRYGEDSTRVAELRAAAERRVLEEKLATLPISESLKDEIRAAMEYAQSLSQTDFSNLSAAAAEAGRIANEIIRAVDAAGQLNVSGAEALADSEFRLKHANDPVRVAGEMARRRMRRTQGVRRDGAEGGELAALDAEVEAYARLNEKIAENNKARTDVLRSGGGGGGGASKRASDQADRLIERLQQELAVMREMDPVQKELARNRAILSEASEGQRQTIEELIATRVEEKRAAQASGDLIGLVGRSTNSILDAMTQKGAKAADVFRDLGVTLLKALLNAQLLGTGPLAGVLGAPEGGWIGKQFGQEAAQASIEALPALAGGGDLQMGGRAAGVLGGRGGPRQDNILFWGSAGEFMQPEASVAYYGRDFMEAVRNRTLPRFANGGPLLAGSSQGRTSRYGSSEMPTIVFNDYSTGVKAEFEGEDRDPEGQRRFIFGLSDKVGEAIDLPGGGASKALRNKYDLNQKRTRR